MSKPAFRMHPDGRHTALRNFSQNGLSQELFYRSPAGSVNVINRYDAVAFI